MNHPFVLPNPGEKTSVEAGLLSTKWGHEIMGCQEKPYHQQVLLVGGLEHFLFSHILGIIIPIDELIFFREVQTTNKYYITEIYDSYDFKAIMGM